MKLGASISIFAAGAFTGILVSLLVSPAPVARRTTAAVPSGPQAGTELTQRQADARSKAPRSQSTTDAGGEAGPAESSSSGSPVREAVGPRTDERDLVVGARLAQTSPDFGAHVETSSEVTLPHEMSMQERTERLMAARPRLPNASNVQVAGYRMPYGPVVEYGNRSNAPIEVGLRALTLAIRGGFEANTRAVGSLTDRAFEVERERFSYIKKVFEEREKAVASLRAQGAGIREFTAYYVDNEAIYVIREGEFPDLDAAMLDLGQFERQMDVTLSDEARRFSK